MKRAPCWKLTIAILLATAPAFADNKSEAQALFDRGVADLQAGKVDEACKELAASLAKVSDSGTKGALAICTTKQGKIATAWQLWRDLAVTAPSDEMKSDAGKNAAELEPRLPKYTVKAPAIAGLVVTVNGSPVDLAVGVPLPVDPGKVAITATAPGYKDYAGEANATEGQTTAIEVPALVAAPKPPPPPIDPDRGGTTMPARSTQKIGLVVAGVGGVSLLGGVVFGLRARGKWNDAKDLCGDIDQCPGDVFPSAKKNYDAASTSATISTVLIGVGVLAIAGGTIWYLKERPREPAMALRPVVTPNQAGVALVGELAMKAIALALAATGCNLVLGLSEPSQEKDGSITPDMPPDAGPFMVTVVVGGTATNPPDRGTVTSDPAGISCPGTCSMSFPAGTEVKLFATASANVNVKSTGLSGGGCNHEIGATPCTITPTGDVTVFSRYWTASNVIFTSSTQKHPGAWDSVAMIDAECNRLADESGLPNPPYRAWISTSQQTADQRIRGLSSGAGVPGVWFRVDGQMFANTLAELETGRVFFSPRLDELGGDVGEAAVVVTDTVGSGAANTGSHCSDWASESASPVLAGEATGGTGRWTAGDLATCNADAHVYCMNGGNSQNFAFAFPSSAVFIFVTTGTFTPGSGPGAADTLCATEAGNATPDPLPGSAHALITNTSAQSVKERYKDFGFSDLPFRPDGFQIASSMGDLFNGGPLFLTPNVTASRAYLDVPIWTGGASFDVFTSDCAGWTASSGFGTGKNASSLRGPTFAQQVTCAAPQHVLCFAGQVFMAKPKH